MRYCIICTVLPNVIFAPVFLSQTGRCNSDTEMQKRHRDARATLRCKTDTDYAKWRWYANMTLRYKSDKEIQNQVNMQSYTKKQEGHWDIKRQRCKSNTDMQAASFPPLPGNFEYWILRYIYILTYDNAILDTAPPPLHFRGILEATVYCEVLDCLRVYFPFWL